MRRAPPDSSAALIGATRARHGGESDDTDAPDVFPHFVSHRFRALFSIGLLAALSRRHAIFILIGIEMMLAAANLNFIAFWRFAPPPHPPTGVMIAIFSIAISAAEAAVGLAMVIAVYRHYRTTNVDQYDQLKG
jgi:NADH:ubiquinone oxidoreductase subunit K